MTTPTIRKTWMALACSSVFLVACASAPIVDPATTAARQKLTGLQSDPNLSNKAPVAFNEAEAAVRRAEAGFKEADAAAHAGYLAEQKVAIAEAAAKRRYLEDQRKGLSQQQDEVRLAARTAEAERAEGEAQRAQNQAQQALSEAEMAREEAARLKETIAELNAKQTERGLVMTLGDVLFETGKADLLAGATANLDKLVEFLNEYEEKTVLIEGHTDSRGSDSFNLTLSQQRADSVRAYLTSRGIGSQRLSASGKGESTPVASNESSVGRQQNRRVEVVIQG
jgi:outer membrane protein OmpA-like peptidoglycan-associated protein